MRIHCKRDGNDYIAVVMDYAGREIYAELRAIIRNSFIVRYELRNKSINHDEFALICRWFIDKNYLCLRNTFPYTFDWDNDFEFHNM